MRIALEVTRPTTGPVCMGCDRRPVREAHTYCRICRVRLRAGLPTDLDEYLSHGEACRARVPGRLLGRWKP